MVSYLSTKYIHCIKSSLLEPCIIEHACGGLDLAVTFLLFRVCASARPVFSCLGNFTKMG